MQGLSFNAWFWVCIAFSRKGSKQLAGLQIAVRALSDDAENDEGGGDDEDDEDGISPLAADSDVYVTTILSTLEAQSEPS